MKDDDNMIPNELPNQNMGNWILLLLLSQYL